MATVKDITNECVTKRAKEWDGAMAVHYKGVPLWLTIYPFNPAECGCSIVLDKYEDEETTEFTILGKTPVIGMEDEFDFSTYGDWETLEEAEKWLENPTILY